MLFWNLLWIGIVATLVELTKSTAVPKEMIDQVENSLLSLFGFKGRPKIDRTKIQIPSAMVEMYEKQMGFGLDTASIPKKGMHTKSANTVRSFTHIESPVDQRFSTHHKFRLKFNIKSIPKDEKLKAAELALNRDIVEFLAKNENEYYQRVLVNDILKPGVKGKHGPITRVIDSKLVDVRSNSVLSLDVLPAVERWLEQPNNNHGILITIHGRGKNKTSPAKHIRLRRDTNPHSDSNSKMLSKTWESIQPMLFTYTDDGKNKQKYGEDMITLRRRRATKHTRRKQDKREPCKRHPMYVDFQDVGWNDWIVAPPGYEAYFCQGQCEFPIADHLNTTNHAIVQTLMNSVSPSKVPKACCVPTQLNSISMLYLDDEGKVVLKNYKEMVVIGCGCR